MRLKEIMTKNPEVMSPETSIAELAKKMRDVDVGDVPICRNNRLIGMVTDRDIAIRAVAEGVDPVNKTAGDIMTEGVVTAYEDQSTEEAAKIMEEKQIRRLPILDRNDQLVGIVSLGDLAVQEDEKTAGEAIKEVSKPAKPER